MRISAKAEYACLAVLELALRSSQSEPVRLTEIAQPNAIPERFLVQILLQLKGSGYVTSLRGASGGYRLTVDPREISLFEVIHAVDGPAPPWLADEAAKRGAGWQVLRDVWHEVTQREEEVLQNTSFAQLVETARRQNANMYYI